MLKFLSFKEWLLKNEDFDGGNFAWVDNLVRELFNNMRELNAFLKSGSQSHYNLTKVYQGFIKQIESSKTSDVRLEDVIRRFAEQVRKDYTFLDHGIEASLQHIYRTLKQHYKQHYGTFPWSKQTAPQPQKPAVPVPNRQQMQPTYQTSRTLPPTGTGY